MSVCWLWIFFNDVKFIFLMLFRNKGVFKKRRTSDEIQKIAAFFPRKEDVLKNLVKLKNIQKKSRETLATIQKKISR